MKTNENQKTTSHQPATQKPFFGASHEQAFFSTPRADSTPFFQAKAQEPSAIQAKSATTDAEGISEEEVQRMPAFESEVTNNGEVQRKLINSPQHSSALPIQAKLTIGEPGDKYEQEADRVASKVVEQINAPAPAQSTLGQSVQRQEENKEELQAKPEITALQRQDDNKEELQAKSNHQNGEANGRGETSTDMISAINSARRGGQPLETGLQRSMGQAMGVDLSGVRVHTDVQSDQLNQSIHAKAFTTGQDVFFRQGAYEPRSRGGQELIAHELTHVVQQNGGAVRRSPLPPMQQIQHDIQPDTQSSTGVRASDGTREIGRKSQVRPCGLRPHNISMVLYSRKQSSTAEHIIQRVVNLDLEGPPDLTSIVHIRGITRPSTPQTCRIKGLDSPDPAARHIIPQALMEREFKARYSRKTVAQLQPIFPSVVIGPNYLIDMAAAMQKAYTFENNFLNRGGGTPNCPEGATAGGARSVLLEPEIDSRGKGKAPRRDDKSSNYKNFWEGSHADNLDKDQLSTKLLKEVEYESDIHFGLIGWESKMLDAGWKPYQLRQSQKILEALAEEFDPPPFTAKAVIKAAANEWARLTNLWLSHDRQSQSYYDIGRPYTWKDAMMSRANKAVYESAK